MPPQILRDYQQRGLREIMAAYRDGARSVLAVAPTGSGKTTLFGTLAAQLSTAGRNVLILVHRRELATQACNRLREFGVQYGLIMAGARPVPYARVQVASVDTLVRRAVPPAVLVICDEAHLSTAPKWRRVLDQYPQARILGVTATPWRLSGKPLAGAYDACVVVAAPGELREQGHLCPYVGFSYLTPDLSGVKTTAGEYNEAQAEKAMGDSAIVDSVVEEWGRHARELSTVVFAVTTAHSRQLTAKFRGAGVAAEHLDGSTPLQQREAILHRVEQGATRVLCNVGVAVEGLDIPRLKCCVLARPTQSLARAIQMMGRVRRPWQGVTARIHDHAFVIGAHGLPDAERDYSLSAKPERPPSLTRCPECFAYYSGTRCTGCDAEHVPVITERAGLTMLTEADVERVEFRSGEEPAAPVRPEKPTRIRWETVGREIEGVFLRRWEEPSAYGFQQRYDVRAKERDYTLPGTADLDRKMRRAVVGARVRVKYVEDTPVPGGKHRKGFKVEVDDAGPDEGVDAAVASYIEARRMANESL